MRLQIEDNLRILQNLPLWGSGRTADLQWFHFGPIREVSDRYGKTTIVGAYALHVQCAWRMTQDDKILVASRDRFYPTGDPYREVQDFEWDKPGANRCDELISELFENQQVVPLIVRDILADNFGGLQMLFERNYTLTVFPDDSLEGEFWRFFTPFSSKEHFIVSGKGIEFE